MPRQWLFGLVLSVYLLPANNGYAQEIPDLTQNNWFFISESESVITAEIAKGILFIVKAVVKQFQEMPSGMVASLVLVDRKEVAMIYKTIQNKNRSALMVDDRWYEAEEEGVTLRTQIVRDGTLPIGIRLMLNTLEGEKELILMKN